MVQSIRQQKPNRHNFRFQFGLFVVCSFLLLFTIISACTDSVSTSYNGESDQELTPAQSPPTLTEIADSIRTMYDLPALGGAIVTISGVSQMAVAGERRYGSGIEVSEGDRWSFGSNTKSITGVMAGMAVEAGVIEWQATVEESFPELAEIMRAEYRDITLKDLLAHRSGFLDSVVPGVDNTPNSSDLTPAAQREMAVEWIIQQVPNNAAGLYHYSNLGYATAGAMLERAVGKQYEEWVMETLGSALLLKEFGFGAHVDEGSEDQPVPHIWQNRRWEAIEAHQSTAFRRPADGAYGTLEDWGKIIAEMMKSRVDASRLISRSTSDVVNSKLSVLSNGNEYSMGWIYIGEWQWAEGETWFHAGTNFANHSMAWVGPEKGVAFIAVTNSFDPGGRTTNALTEMMFSLLKHWEETH